MTAGGECDQSQTQPPWLGANVTWNQSVSMVVLVTLSRLPGSEKEKEGPADFGLS